MFINDSYSELSNPTSIEFSTFLANRYDHNANNFWISHTKKSYPILAVLIKGNLGAATYFPVDGHPGFSAAAKKIIISDSTDFYISTDETVNVEPEYILTLDETLNIISDFTGSYTMLGGIEWHELC